MGQDGKQPSKKHQMNHLEERTKWHLISVTFGSFNSKKELNRPAMSFPFLCSIIIQRQESLPQVCLMKRECDNPVSFQSGLCFAQWMAKVKSVFSVSSTWIRARSAFRVCACIIVRSQSYRWYDSSATCPVLGFKVSSWYPYFTPCKPERYTKQYERWDWTTQLPLSF